MLMREAIAQWLEAQDDGGSYAPIGKRGAEAAAEELLEYMREHVAYPSARAFFFSCRDRTILDTAERRRLKEAERKRIDRLASKGVRVCRVTGIACRCSCPLDECHTSFSQGVTIT